jgi:hypothetical protein
MVLLADEAQLEAHFGKRTDIGEHFTWEISPEYRICFIRKEKECDD